MKHWTVEHQSSSAGNYGRSTYYVVDRHPNRNKRDFGSFAITGHPVPTEQRECETCAGRGLMPDLTKVDALGWQNAPDIPCADCGGTGQVAEPLVELNAETMARRLAETLNYYEAACEAKSLKDWTEETLALLRAAKGAA